MSQRLLLHVCKLCGKRYATVKALYGHQRVHSGKTNLQRICGVKEEDSRVWSSSKESELEQHEINEAARNLVLLSKHDFSAISNLHPVDSEMQEKNIHCVESKEELSETGLVKSGSCSDVVALGTGESISRYKCKICGKSFVCFQALCGHQNLHRSVTGQFTRKKEGFDGDCERHMPTGDINMDQEKISHCAEAKESELYSETGCSLPSTLRVKPSVRFKICGKSFEVSPASGGHKTLQRSTQGQLARKKEDTGEDVEMRPEQEKNLLSVESELNLGEPLLDHLDYEQKTRISALTSQQSTKTSYECKICGKSFGCFQAVGGHQRVHRSTQGQLARKEEDTEGGNSMSELH